MSAPSQADVANAFGNKLYQLFGKGLTQGAFMSIINGGYAFSDDVWGWLNPPDFQKNADYAHSFANLVNTIPKGVGNWSASGSSVPYVYRSIFLATCAVPNYQLSSSEKEELAAATKYVQDNNSGYVSYQTLYQAASTDLLEVQMLSPRPSDYVVKISKAKTKQANALQQWIAMGNKTSYETNLAVMQHLSGLGYDQIVTGLQSKFDNNQATDNEGVTFAPVNCVPTTFYQTTVPMNNFTFNFSEVSTYSSNSTTNWGGGVSGAYDFFWGSADASGQSNRTSYECDTSNLSISFDYARVSLDRSNWMDTFLLESQAWWWPGATQSNPTFGMVFSDGSTPDKNKGQWQMIPTEAIFTRNLVVKLDMTSTINKTTFDKVTTQASVGFLFWKIGGAYYSSTTSTSSYNFQKSDSGFTCPALQCIGFLCDLMPKEPNPDPNFLPTTSSVVPPKVFHPLLNHNGHESSSLNPKSNSKESNNNNNSKVRATKFNTTNKNFI